MVSKSCVRHDERRCSELMEISPAKGVEGVGSVEFYHTGMYVGSGIKFGADLNWTSLRRNPRTIDLSIQPTTPSLPYFD